MVYGHPVPSTFTAHSLTHLQKYHITKHFSPLFNARSKIPIIRPANVSFLHQYTLIITSPIHTLVHMYGPTSNSIFQTPILSINLLLLTLTRGAFRTSMTQSTLSLTSCCLSLTSAAFSAIEERKLVIS